MTTARFEVTRALNAEIEHAASIEDAALVVSELVAGTVLRMADDRDRPGLGTLLVHLEFDAAYVHIAVDDDGLGTVPGAHATELSLVARVACRAWIETAPNGATRVAAKLGVSGSGRTQPPRPA